VERENLVTACTVCQYGRGRYTIEEVVVDDPRGRPPRLDRWDGLTRLAATPRA
jgi:hypothetical protein